ncbi:hypothetical protein UFOVP1326_30 [uncultured Caudovirales phage]|uniref:Uncharacterized protein n=1 Tax=uncultured Caudovirales phage TaxID=2100421 RepID=A0A6J5SEJ8_9CAUD|nr:hypothetical protein UFOVP1326_30 [uncultured Caudovirales phage]CAB4212409.1 hypothetical protein UFOVP1436_9 [uncultured Caudovirales phage]
MTPDDNAALINGLISILENASQRTIEACALHELPFDDAVVVVGVNGAYIGPLVKALHELKATSSRIDILESQIARLKQE